MGERGKRINWASEIEGRKRKHNDSAVGSAVNASPCGSASVVASPVGEEVAVGIGLKAEAGESVGVETLPPLFFLSSDTLFFFFFLFIKTQLYSKK